MRSRSRSRSPHHRRDRISSRSKDHDRDRRKDRRRDHDRVSRHRTRSRSPVPVRRRHSRSRSPRRRRSPSVSPSRARSRSHEKDKKEQRTVVARPQITDADLVGKTDEEIEMMRLMGFSDFDSSKNKHVSGNNCSAVNIIHKRKYRQYMNRKGGFNRPLDFVA